MKITKLKDSTCQRSLSKQYKIINKKREYYIKKYQNENVKCLLSLQKVTGHDSINLNSILENSTLNTKFE